MHLSFASSRSLLALWLVVGLSGCATEEPSERAGAPADDWAAGEEESDLQSSRSNPAASFPADVAVRIGITTADVVRLSKLPPPLASRVFGYVGVALHEAVLPGIQGEISFASRLTGLSAPPRLKPSRNFDWRLAAAFAGTQVLAELVGDPAARAAAESRYASIREELEARGLDPQTKARTEAYARAVADNVLARAGRDGFADRASRPYAPPDGDVAWVPTANRLPALEPGWGGLQPWAMPTGDACLYPLHEAAAFSG